MVPRACPYYGDPVAKLFLEYPKKADVAFLSDGFQSNSFMRFTPIGLVSKKLRLLIHLLYPLCFSVCEHIDVIYASVRYSNVSIIKTLDKGCFIGTIDIKSAFRLLSCCPGGIQFARY